MPPQGLAALAALLSAAEDGNRIQFRRWKSDRRRQYYRHNALPSCSRHFSTSSLAKTLLCRIIHGAVCPARLGQRPGAHRDATLQSRIHCVIYEFKSDQIEIQL